MMDMLLSLYPADPVNISLINLMLQSALMGLLLISIYFSKRRIAFHCRGVTLATAINLISILSVMIPSIIKGIIYPPVHITLGSITEFLAIFTSASYKR